MFRFLTHLLFKPVILPNGIGILETELPGSGANNQAFVGVYSAAGTYPVSLQVESAVGCKSPVVTKNLVISPNPVANFDLPGVCLPSGVALFKNLSTVADNSTLKYLWNFGDGGNDTQPIRCMCMLIPALTRF